MKLTVHNYGIIEDLEINLVPGLTVLVGQNGSGKSTTVDALYFAITGDTIDGRNVAERINWGAVDGKAVVKLAADDFVVERTIKSTGVSHSLKAGELVLTKKTDINAFLFSKFNLDNTGVLKDVFFAAQLHATDLFDSTDSARLAMLAKVFGLDKLEQCRAAILKTLAETPAPTLSPELIAAAEAKVTMSKQNLDTGMLNLTMLQAELDSHPFDETGYARAMELPLDTEKATRRTMLEQAAEYLEKTFPELERLRLVVKNYDEAHAYQQHLLEAKEREDYRAKIEKELAELSVAGPSAQSFSKALAEAMKRKALLEAEIESLRSRTVEQLTVCPLTKGAPCIELIRANDPDLLAQELKEKEALMLEINGDIKQLEGFIEEQEKVAEHKASLLASKKLLDSTKEETVPVPEALKDKSLEEIDEYIKSLGDIPTARTDLSNMEKAYNDSLQIKQTNEAWLAQRENAECITQEERDDWQKKRLEQQAKLNEISRLRVQVDAYTAAFSSDQAALDQLRAEQKRCEAFGQRCVVLRTARELLSKGQLQRALLSNTIEQLNREVLVCAKLLDFKYPLFITDTGSVRFIGEHENEADVKALSGGQKYAAAIMLRLAFSRVIQSSFPFIVLDEPSTCLDVQSRQLLAALLSALHKRSRESGGYLVVPTHDELLVSATDQVVQI